MTESAADQLLAQFSGLVLLGVGALLVYRIFREKYLLAWILGWIGYVLHELLGAFSASMPDPRPWLAVSHVAFVLALFMFATAVLFYTNAARRHFLPLALWTVLTVILTIMRFLWWSDVHAVALLLGFLYLGLRVAAALQLAYYSQGRSNLGPWLLIATLLVVHADEGAANAHTPFGIEIPALDPMVEILLGMSIVLVILDEARARALRLQVLTAIGQIISEAQESVGMMRGLLAELKRLMEARSAWFRLLDSEGLVMAAHLGLDDSYLASRRVVPLRQSFSERVMREGRPALVHVAATSGETRERMLAQGFEHIILVPVRGKSFTIGVLSLGVARRRFYSPAEMRFLATASHLLGIAVENVRMFEQILRSQKQWVSTFDSISDAILVHDQTFRIMKVNRAFEARLRVPVQDVISRSCEQVLPHGSWSGCPYCSLGVLSENPDPCFGGYSLVSTSTYSEQGSERRGTIHIIQDVTERRRAEENYHRLFEEMREGVFISTPDGRLLDCNREFVRILGCRDRNEVLALDAASLYERPEEREQFQRQMERHGFVRNYEFQLRRKDGEVITVLESSFATRDAAGRVERYQGFVLDITEKKRAENEIRRRNRELNALNAIAVAANQLTDLDQVLGLAMRHVVELFSADTGAVYLMEESTRRLQRRAAFGHRSQVGGGLPGVEIPPEFWTSARASQLELITHEHLPQLPALVSDFVQAEGLAAWLWMVLWSGEKVVGVLGVSSRTPRQFSESDKSLMLAIGRQLAITIQKTLLYEETRRAYDNLTRTQEQLLQSEKMSAIGQLISGVAHELNNPLTAIVGYTQLLDSEPMSGRARDFLNKLYRQAQRTHRVVQNLLSFARQRKPQRKPVDLGQVLEETLALRDYDLKLNNITVERRAQPGLPPVVADAHQLEQVFLNIINNAADAMLEQGNVGNLQVHAYEKEGEVRVEFRDNGPGIRDPKRVFDPFYTTKAVGKGTGLGLSICYGIVKEHGGQIVAGNHPEGGAVFEVRLPISEQVVAAEDRPLPAPGRRVEGRVLLVDDEEAVLEFQREVLTAAGATVTALTSAEGARSLIAREEFDLVILDGKMPGSWGGPELYRWMLQNRPTMQTRVVFAVSALDDPNLRKFVEEQGTPCIMKPFEADDLLHTARKVISGNRPLGSTVAAP